MTRRVAILAFDGAGPFELAMAAEVFGAPVPEISDDWYETVVCSATGGPVRTTAGMTLTPAADLTALRGADTVVVPGWPGTPAGRDPDDELLDALRACHEDGARVLSICTRAFALAAAGLLDGREATTHWRYADRLARRFPRVTVNPAALYVDAGSVLTSAGGAAGLDLALHLVRRDHGAQAANDVARGLVVPAHRDGDQAQYVRAPVPVAGDHRLSHAMQWALKRLDEPIGPNDLASRAYMSSRSLHRHFRRAVGMAPSDWLARQRVRASLAHLEDTDLPVEAVARRVGYTSADTYRTHFGRVMSTTPTKYRRAFWTGRAQQDA